MAVNYLKIISTKISSIMFTKQFFKYLIVGTIYASTGLLVFGLFVDVLHFKAVYVYMIWTPLSFIVRYVVDKLWVFKLK